MTKLKASSRWPIEPVVAVAFGVLIASEGVALFFFAEEGKDWVRNFSNAIIGLYVFSLGVAGFVAGRRIERRLRDSVAAKIVETRRRVARISKALSAVAVLVVSAPARRAAVPCARLAPCALCPVTAQASNKMCCCCCCVLP